MREGRRALLIARNLPPLRGGIERLMQNALGELAAEWEIDVIGPRGCATQVPGVRVRAELPPGAAGFLAGAFANLLRDRRPYDLVLASNGVMAPAARFAARLSHCPYMVWIHGLDVAYPNLLYRALFLPSLQAADGLIANSQYTAGLAAAAGFEARRTRVIPPGVDVEPAAEGAAAALRARLGLAGQPVLLFVGRLVERKGLIEFVNQALPAIVRAVPAVRLLVVGSEPDGSGRYRQRLRTAAEKEGIGSTLMIAGELGDPDLRAAYSAADALVFPVLDRPGDVEGFGMVVVEAAAQGTPSVVFSAGGVPDAISAEAGIALPPGDYAAMSAAVIAILTGGRRFAPERCRAHATAYRWERYGDAVRAACRELAR